MRIFLAGASGVIGPAPRLELVVEADAHEGPVYVAADDALYFTTVPRPGPDGPLVAIRRLDLGRRAVTTVREDANAANGMTLVCDGERLTGAYAAGPEAGEWLQQATVAIRARIPLAVMRDVIQPFPTFSEAVFQALRDLDAQVSRAGATPVTAAAD